MGTVDGRVVHLVPRWLPTSERFVHELVVRGRRPYVVLSADAPVNRDRFPVAPLVSLRPVNAVPARWRGRAGAAAVLAATVRWRGLLMHVHFGYRLHQALPTVRRRRLPLVVSLHGHDVTGLLRADPTFYGDALARADAVIVPSRFLAERAVDAGAPAARLEVIPAGVDVSLLRPTPVPRDPVVTFAGRFVEKKGLDVLAAAWPAVRAAVPDARLVTAGYGPLAPMARAVADEVILEPAHGDVVAALQRSRVVVSPSRTAGDGDSDSLLLVNLEAQALGRPVVSTRHGGIPEFVEDGSSGLLVAESNPQELAEALIAVLSDDAFAQRLGSHGPRVAARYDSALMATQVDALYDRLLGA